MHSERSQVHELEETKSVLSSDLETAQAESDVLRGERGSLQAERDWLRTEVDEERKAYQMANERADKEARKAQRFREIIYGFEAASPDVALQDQLAALKAQCRAHELTISELTQRCGQEHERSRSQSSANGSKEGAEAAPTDESGPDLLRIQHELEAARIELESNQNKMRASATVRKQLQSELSDLRKQVARHTEQDVRRHDRLGSGHGEISSLITGMEADGALQQVKQIRTELTAWRETRQVQRELADCAMSREQLKCESEVIARVLRNTREGASSAHDGARVGPLLALRHVARASQCVVRCEARLTLVNELHSRCSIRVAEQAELPPLMRSWRYSVMCGTSMSVPSALAVHLALPSQLARSSKEGVGVKNRELIFCTCRSKTYAEERHRLAMQLETQGGRLPAKVRTSDTAHDD